MPTIVPLPKSTRSAWIAWNGIRHQDANPGLLFARFLEFDIGNDASNPHFSSDSLKNTKESNLDIVVRYSAQADPILFGAWNKRWLETVKAAGAEPFYTPTDWRFVPGFGIKGSLEVGFSFHRYGFPYLPGSAVKGIARTRAVIALGELLSITNLQQLDDALNVKPSDNQRESDAVRLTLGLVEITWTPAQEDAVHEFRLIFGTPDAAGKAIFFSAIPRSANNSLPKLERDILNPHFSNYYREGTTSYPTDGENPIPVGFLVVAKDQQFFFAVGWRGAPNATLLDKAKGWLQDGLKDLGAGAKTTSGYGYFINFSDFKEQAQTQDTTIKQSTKPIERRYAIVSKKQSQGTLLQTLDVQTNHSVNIPKALFGGNTPGGGKRIYYELQGDQITKAGLA